MTKDVESLFMYLTYHLFIFFCEVSIQTFANVIFFAFSWVVKVYLLIQVFDSIRFENIFSQYFTCFFIFLSNPSRTKVLSFDEV